MSTHTLEIPRITGELVNDDSGPLLQGCAVVMSPTGNAVGAWRTDLGSHRAHWGRRTPRHADAGRSLHREIEQIGLTGRGGGHFPVAIKWGPALQAGPGGTIVVNAAEGEPASAKDSVLWQCRPHLVLDGAAALAEMLAAREVVLWLHADATATRVSMEQAIAERQQAGEPDPPVRILLAPVGYVSGEASAVIAGVRGQPVAPTFIADPARPWGDGPPILVHNTETVARIGMVTATGADGYPSSSLITVAHIDHGRITQRVVVEVASNDSVADALRLAGTGMDGSTTRGATTTGAILLGGYAGTWHRGVDAASLPLDPAALRARGLSLGAGIIITVPDVDRVLTETIAITDYLAGESAGQCGPCQFGLPALVRALDRQRFAEIDTLAAPVAGRGGCRMPDGAVRMVTSAVDLLHSAPGGGQ